MASEDSPNLDETMPEAPRVFDRSDRVAEVQDLPWGITVLHSPDTRLLGQEVRILRALIVGRGSGSEGGVDVSVADKALSRRHVRLERHAEAYLLEDLGSMNGTFVDGVRVRRAKLEEGALIRIGGTLLEFGLVGDADRGYIPDPVFIGRTPVVQRLLKTARREAPGDASIFIRGEPGVGKGLLARRIHELSGRAGDFVTVGCKAVPDEVMAERLRDERAGYLSTARGGTLYLEDVDALEAQGQAALAEVLERRAGEVRILSCAATSLGESLEAGLARQLGEVDLEVPPLRRRRGDVPLLMLYFLERAAPDQSFEWTPGFLQALMLFPWPQNVRQLEAIAHSVAGSRGGEGGSLAPNQLPWEIRGPMVKSGRRAPSQPRIQATPIARPGPQELSAALAEAAGNVTEVAGRFGRSRSQIYRWVRLYDLDLSAFRR